MTEILVSTGISPAVMKNTKLRCCPIYMTMTHFQLHINSVINNFSGDTDIFLVSITVYKDFPDFSIPTIIFKAFQGLENFYIKFLDLPYFSRTCTNPALTV